MNSELEIIFNTLNTGICGEQTYLELLREFFELSGKTQKVSEDEKGFSEVFYQILNQGKSVYSSRLELDCEDFPVETKKLIIDSFKNIRNIHICDNSSSKVVWFLSELQKSGNLNYEESQKTILETVSVLLDVLDNISYVFYFRDDQGGLVFPINKMIGHFIDNPDFINAEGITPEKIQTLQLAVKLFKTDFDGKQILEKIKTECNMVFISYLEENCKIIDTKDLLNYKMNNTLIFFDSSNSRVLIRNEKREYFKTDNNDDEIREEIDCSGKVIGFFVEKTYTITKRFSFSDFLYFSEEDRVKILCLMFDQGNKNILMDFSLYRDESGNVLPINPFCSNDEYIIVGGNNRNGEEFHNSQLIDAIKMFRICPVKAKVLNRLSLGLIAQLCTIKNDSVEALLSSLNTESWFQNQVIQRWLNLSSVGIIELKKILGIWYEQIKYCTSLKEIEEYAIRIQDFFPLRFDSFTCLYEKLVPCCGSEVEIRKGKIHKDDESEKIEGIIIDGGEEISSSCIVNDYYDDDFDLLSNGAEVFVLYSESAKKIYLSNQWVLRTIDAIKRLQNHALSFDVGKNVDEEVYSSIVDRMRLFSNPFYEVIEKKDICRLDDFDSPAYIRIVNNMIWSEINTIEKVHDYLSVICHNQVIAFHESKEGWSQLISGKDLVIPKEREGKDSVLSCVFSFYLKSRAEREEYSLYDLHITKRNGRYMFRDTEITSIVMLTDNFLSGFATIISIRAYLGIRIDSNDPLYKRYKQACDSLVLMNTGSKTVTIKNIMDYNPECSFSVVGLFGTREGALAIDAFLEGNHIPHKKTEYIKEITEFDGAIKKKAFSVWGKKEGYEMMKDSHYPIIREFSMPKKTIFPSAMLDDANKAICLFVRRKELE